MKKFLVLRTKEEFFLVNPYRLKWAIIDHIDFELCFTDEIENLNFEILNERELKEGYALGCLESGLGTEESVKSIEESMKEAQKHELIF